MPRAQMLGVPTDFSGDRLLLIPADHREDEAGCNCRRKHGAHRKSAEERPTGSWLMRCERVSSEQLNCTGSRCS
jgi:hypothetical protein